LIMATVRRKTVRLRLRKEPQQRIGKHEESSANPRANISSKQDILSLM
jgi:hypothetical protein